jgi:hypothetical protein
VQRRLSRQQHQRPPLLSVTSAPARAESPEREVGPAENGGHAAGRDDLLRGAVGRWRWGPSARRFSQRRVARPPSSARVRRASSAEHPLGRRPVHQVGLDLGPVNRSRNPRPARAPLAPEMPTTTGRVRAPIYGWAPPARHHRAAAGVRGRGRVGRCGSTAPLRQGDELRDLARHPGGHVDPEPAERRAAHSRPVARWSGDVGGPGIGARVGREHAVYVGGRGRAARGRWAWRDVRRR